MRLGGKLAKAATVVYSIDTGPFKRKGTTTVTVRSGKAPRDKAPRDEAPRDKAPRD